MRIPELFARGKPVFSFEFFQPKSVDDEAAFVATVRELKALEPGFVTITYGAAGSARERTFDTASMIQSQIGITTAAHLTCIAHTRAELVAILERLQKLGIENLVALRGDVPRGASPVPPERREVPYAADLVRLVRSSQRPFAVAVAGYPEKHPEARDRTSDLAHLKAKVDAGGDWVITQLFFDNADYFAFVRAARSLGVTAPIVPGIMPVTGYAQTKRFTEMCGARIPSAMEEGLAAVAEDKEALVRFGIDWAARQCRELLEQGAPGIHFYTLNRSRSTATILAGLREWL
jgi:methylenetetrahydrofolate reductase (NADPH)